MSQLDTLYDLKSTFTSPYTHERFQTLDKNEWHDQLNILYDLKSTFTSLLIHMILTRNVSTSLHVIQNQGTYFRFHYFYYYYLIGRVKLRRRLETPRVPLLVYSCMFLSYQCVWIWSSKTIDTKANVHQVHLLSCNIFHIFFSS